LLRRFSDDEGDAVAHSAHPAGAEERMQRAQSLRTAHVFRHHRHESAELVGDYFKVGTSRALRRSYFAGEG
jgi:hypothetical protein